VQVVPETHVVGPVHPIPPHCPHFAEDPTPLEEVLVGALVVALEAAEVLVLPLVTL
jgi:hypothetical protein